MFSLAEWAQLYEKALHRPLCAQLFWARDFSIMILSEGGKRKKKSKNDKKSQNPFSAWDDIEVQVSIAMLFQ